MANASTTGFGLRTVTTVGNTPATSGQSEYKIKSGLGVGIFKNNPVSFMMQLVTKVIYKMQVLRQLMMVEQVELLTRMLLTLSYWCVQWSFLYR